MLHRTVALSTQEKNPGTSTVHTQEPGQRPPTIGRRHVLRAELVRSDAAEGGLRRQRGTSGSGVAPALAHTGHDKIADRSAAL